MIKLIKDKNIKFPVPYIDMPIDISIDDIDRACNYFIELSNTKFFTPEYTRGWYFYGSLYLRFPNTCMNAIHDVNEEVWDRFFNTFLKIKQTPEHREFYNHAIDFFKPYAHNMQEALEKYTGDKFYIQGVEVNMMVPGTEIKEHIDQHLYDAQTHRVHLVLCTNDDAYMICNGEQRHYDKGQCFIFNNKMPHSVQNKGDTPRIHLVVDLLQIQSDA
jgi:hypothetical protein